MPNSLLPLLLSQLLSRGGQTQPQPQPNSQASPPPPKQPQGQQGQQGSQPNASPSQPKPSPLELVLPAIQNIISQFLGSQRGAPRSFQYGGIAGQNGPETIRVGEKGPEAITPINQSTGQGGLPNLLALLGLLSQRGMGNPNTPKISPAGPPLPLYSKFSQVLPGAPEQSPIRDLIDYFRSRSGGQRGLPPQGYGLANLANMGAPNLSNMV